MLSSLEKEDTISLKYHWDSTSHRLIMFGPPSPTHEESTRYIYFTLDTVIRAQNIAVGMNYASNPRGKLGVSPGSNFQLYSLR
ncbi:hypothetical protein SERLADRAFT_391385, partial [Serpula lacrymans var. lacrymans S7.9]